MTEETPDLTSLLTSDTTVFPDAATRLAQWAYRLACAGPGAFLVMALAYPPTDPFALPAVPVQILWWALALASPFGAALGVITLVLMRCDPARAVGKNHGMAAMIVGCAATLALFYGTRDLNAIRRMNYTAGVRCDSNLKQLSVSMQMYTQDYDECYPPGATWNAATLPYSQNRYLYLCPEEDDRNLPSYALNRQLQGKRSSSVNDPARTVLLFDSVPGENRSGGQELLPHPDRHEGHHVFGLSDGHVKSVPIAETSTLLWTPLAVTPRSRQAAVGGAH